jgi:hypothetical protein
MQTSVNRRVVGQKPEMIEGVPSGSQPSDEIVGSGVGICFKSVKKSIVFNKYGSLGGNQITGISGLRRSGEVQEGLPLRIQFLHFA